jgi:uncharacterized protein YuzE
MGEKINISHHYDPDADILYIDFGSNEPCYTEDIDGIVMVDVGWFSKLPLGIKIISPKAHKMEAVHLRMVIEDACRRLMQKQARQIENETPLLQHTLDNSFDQMLSHV